ncbi:MAG: hypothetical protein AAGF12_31230 [Myxococcota bacterium]
MSRTHCLLLSAALLCIGPGCSDDSDRRTPVDAASGSDAAVPDATLLGCANDDECAADCMGPSCRCLFEPSVCSGPRRCVEAPMDCTLTPVCGCDGTTYENGFCQSFGAGVSLQSDGACP